MHRNIFSLMGLLSCGIIVSACAAEPPQTDKPPTDKPSGGNTCVFFSVLYDWQALDDRNMVVWVPGKNDAYHLRLTMPLPTLKSALKLGFIDEDQDGRLCSSGRDAITIADHARPGSTEQSAKIRSIVRLTDVTLAQLEATYQVTLKRESKRKAPPKVPDGEITQ